ncbi:MULTISPECIES: type VI immunity family protein [Variovorax]|uniref:type VI immunity family protein n=1 Tax=Variovorax TaxID=34072 RepID=UPI00285995D4|nr:type VI immunity family protein [Variovorax sp. 3319]MDR6887729.1 hypothetical protein [Variovorax sp. 3319]
MEWHRFTLAKDGQVLAMPCVDIVAFVNGVPDNGGAGFARFLNDFAHNFGGQLRFYRTGDMKRFRAFDAQALEGPAHWFTDPRLLAANMLSFRAHSGGTARDVCPPAVDMTLAGVFEPPRFILRMILPVEWGDEPEQLVSLAQTALAELQLGSGYCGYSLVWEETDTALEEKVLAWAGPLHRRHPGLGYGDAVCLSNAVDRGVVAVNWLTFLGAELVAALGGSDALASSAAAEVSVLPLGQGGVILRAGEAPKLGDVNRKDLLPAYHAVGRLVGPVRATDEALDELLIDAMSEEDAYDWLRRFFV